MYPGGLYAAVLTEMGSLTHRSRVWMVDEKSGQALRPGSSKYVSEYYVQVHLDLELYLLYVSVSAGCGLWLCLPTVCGAVTNSDRCTVPHVIGPPVAVGHHSRTVGCISEPPQKAAHISTVCSVCMCMRACACDGMCGRQREHYKPTCRRASQREASTLRRFVFCHPPPPHPVPPPPAQPDLLTRPQDTGNKVSRKANLIGTQHIMLGGKTVIMAEAMVRGDLTRTATPATGTAPGSNTAVFIGRYCFLSKGSCLRPPGRIYKG